MQRKYLTENPALGENWSSASGKRGFHPCFCLPACCNCPVALSEFATCFIKAPNSELGSFKKCNCSREARDCKISFAPQMWAARPHLANIFEKLLDQKTFYFACGSILTTNSNHKKEDSRPFLRIGYLLLRMFVLHQKHREWTFRTISPTEAYFPGISPKISMAEKTFDTILFHSAKPLLTASHQSVLAFQFQPAVLDGSIP